MTKPSFNDETVNIFTDASVIQLDDGTYVSCSGAVAYVGYIEHPRIIDEQFQINYDSTNNNGEIIAIEKGIEIALKLKKSKQYRHFNLFSDSKICILGLREWIKNWDENSKKRGVNQLIGSTNLPVSNQDEIVRCVHLILDNNLKIKLYHQRGHMNDRCLQTSVKSFKDNNHISQYVNNDYIHNINMNNNYVDEKSRGILTDAYVSGNINKQKPIMVITRIYDPDKIDIDKYLALVNN